MFILNKLFWIDGRIVNEKESGIDRTDLGLIRGYGVFDFFRTYGKTPFHFDEHFDRFILSAKTVDLEIPYSKEKIYSAVLSLINLHPAENLGIKMYLTAGKSDDAFFHQGNCSFWIVVAPLSFLAFDQAIQLKTVPITREIPTAKTLNYMQASIYANRFKRLGYDDIIYLDQNKLLESSTSNLFFIQKNRLITANANILEGITRKVVLELAQSQFEIELREVLLEELPLMDECFVTSTTKEICPVNRIDNCMFQSNHPNSKTLMLKKIFQEEATKILQLH